MRLRRMDLDGSGSGSPMGLVTRILKAEPGLTIPIPIEDLAQQLDIEKIQDLTTDGFEGGLVTDESRSTGFILVNRAARRGRRRFTIGHELGHFLMTSHKPPQGGFLCSRADMRQWTDKEKSAAIRMEVEANEFSSLILMPPPILRKEMAKFGDPDLAQIVSLATIFDVSKEAVSRAYAQYHEQPVAVVVIKDGKVDKIYRDVRRFPEIALRSGAAAPRESMVFRATKQLHSPSAIVEADAGSWLASEWGRPLPTLYEQVFFQQGGYALLMLWTELNEEEDDSSEDKTSKQRFQDQHRRWSR